MREHHFDRWAFDNRRPLPVSQTTKISFEDYGRMSTHLHKPSGERRLPTPEWAANDLLLRNLLVVFIESRARVVPAPELSLLERLARAQRAIALQRSQKDKVLTRLCKRLVDLKNQGVPSEEIRALEIEIENLDTFLRTTRVAGGADIVAAIVYLYYRALLDSVGVAAQLGIKPPHVRHTLWKLDKIWKAKFVRPKRVWRKKIVTVRIDVDGAMHISARLAAKRFQPTHKSGKRTPRTAHRYTK